MNHITIIGRLSNDPEIRQTQSGLSVCSFTVAVNNGKDKDGKEREADFINCKAWRQTAEFISRYFTKGKMIAIEGKFKTDKYKHPKHDDITVYNSYVLVDSVEFCGDKSTSQAQNVANKAQAAGIAEEYVTLLDDDSAPF